MIAQKIYLIRHGQTDFNRLGIVQGSGIDSSLNEHGQMEAMKFYNFFRSEKFDRIYTSTLKRSIQSVAQFVKDGCTVEAHTALNEISWGKQEGKPINATEELYYKNMLRLWQQGKTAVKIEGGESPDEVAQRQEPFINLLKSRPDDKKIIICMHGRAMRILLCGLLHYPLQCMALFEHNNLGLYLLHYTGNQFVINQYNTTIHLKINVF